ncbi:GNAT family N-acetyltransferase [Pontivivens ytuae]|uniref:GNAT family N-acetyltransferase n=1 Tax=Pontivivens ytuae TaxID=2789856 RepID=A0A7S9LVC4_9RHOB|nr:GNAT family N-acetyltransferase [Pontivivens ytuae]QPH55660.1 GNAT family N-acetyltransferase [Pontivivens ytuae]
MDTIKPRVRVARGFIRSEAQRVADIYWSAFEDKLGGVLGRPEQAKKVLADCFDPDFALVARLDDDGRIAGVAGFKTEQGSMTGGFDGGLARHYSRFGATWRAMVLSLLEREERADNLLADGIAVAPDMRGRGVGTALLYALDEEARARGKRGVRLDVIDRNIRARALYERHGYDVTGTQELGVLRHIFGFRSATTMTRTL